MGRSFFVAGESMQGEEFDGFVLSMGREEAKIRAAEKIGEKKCYFQKMRQERCCSRVWIRSQAPIVCLFFFL